MKQFFKFMFASMLGFFLTWIIIAVLFLFIIVSAASMGGKKEVKIKENAVLYLKLDNSIVERESNNPFENFDIANMQSKQSTGLNQLIRCIKLASEDKLIKGIYLNVENVPAGMASVEEIRNALIEFKKSGKFIVSYANNYSQNSYYLSSVADKIYLNPQGEIDLKGFSIQIMFYKNALEKLEIEPQIIRHGKFKAAVEPFLLDKMSEANKEQLLTFLNSTWNHYTNQISIARKIDVETINKVADSLFLLNTENTLKYKFVDSLIYKDELFAVLKNRLNLKEEDDINFVSLSQYAKTPYVLEEKFKTKDKIAIIYAVGNIQDGEGDNNVIGGESISKEIRNARLDKNVKAIVLRVNSPGGSALASEIIWREVLITKKVKPIVVSMGDYAASGGYYISCAASSIVAQPNTLTGSIGVFGMIPNLKKILNNKLGVTLDEASTNKYSDFMNIMRPMDKYEYSVLQNVVEKTYKTFIKHISDSRNIAIDEVDSIGQGRIWSGIDAKRLNLVDEIGGIDKAIEIAAKKANITEYRIVNLPAQKEFIEKLLENTQMSYKSIIEKEFGESILFIEYINSLKNMKGVQARLPFVFEIK